MHQVVKKDYHYIRLHGQQNVILSMIFIDQNTLCGVLENGRLNKYRGADKSLARPERKQANVSVRMA